MTPLRFLPSLAALALLAPALGAQTFTYEVCIDDAQAGLSTGGSGSAVVTFELITSTVSVTGSYTGLSSDQTTAHIHSGAVGMNGGIVVGLAGTGGTSGTLSGGGLLSSSDAMALMAGNTYINIHTSMHIGGEIRGQIVQLVDSTEPAELPGDPVLSDSAGAGNIGPRVFCSPESFNLTIDCSGASSGGIYLIEVRTGRLAMPLMTKFGFAYLTGTKIGSKVGMHGMDAQSFFNSPMALPADPGLIGFTYHAQGFCGGFSPKGRTSNLLTQTVGI